MKLIFLITVALILIVRENSANPSSSCLDQCSVSVRFPQMPEKAVEKWQLLKNSWTDASIPSSMIPMSQAEFDLFCRGMRYHSSCLYACTNQSVPVFRQIREDLHEFINFTCDTEIQSKYQCISEVDRQPSECDTRCNQKVTLNQTVARLGTSRTEDQESISRQIPTLVCQHMNCRLICRKDAIIAGCGNDGYETAKKIVRSLGGLRVPFMRQMGAFVYEGNVEACGPEKIVQGA